MESLEKFSKFCKGIIEKILEINGSDEIPVKDLLMILSMVTVTSIEVSDDPEEILEAYIKNLRNLFAEKKEK